MWQTASPNMLSISFVKSPLTMTTYHTSCTVYRTALGRIIFPCSFPEQNIIIDLNLEWRDFFLAVDVFHPSQAMPGASGVFFHPQERFSIVLRHREVRAKTDQLFYTFPDLVNGVGARQNNDWSMPNSSFFSYWIQTCNHMIIVVGTANNEGIEAAHLDSHYMTQ